MSSPKTPACSLLVFLLLSHQRAPSSAAILDGALHSNQEQAKSLSDSVFHASKLKAKMLPTVLAYPSGDMECHNTPGDHGDHPPETSHQTCARTPQRQDSQDSSPKDTYCDDRCQEKLLKESEGRQRSKAQKLKEDQGRAFAQAQATGICRQPLLPQLSPEDCRRAQALYQAEQKSKQKEKARLEGAFNKLSGIGKIGYISSILFSALGLAGGLGVLGFLASGIPLALGLGALGLAAGIPLAYFSANNPGSFHEGFGAALITPFALTWGLLSGPFFLVSGGWVSPPSWGPEKNKTVKSYFDTLHTAAQIAGTAATLAASGTLIAAGALPLAGSAVAIPVASSIASAITPIGAIAGGSVLVGGGLAWGIKELAQHVAQNSKIVEIAEFKTKSTPKQDKDYWQEKIKSLDQDKIKQLHQDVLDKKQAQDRLKTIYGPGSLAHGAQAKVPYNIPELVIHKAHIDNPQAAGLIPYGSALEPQRQAQAPGLSQSKRLKQPGIAPRPRPQQTPLFSLWGPSFNETTSQGLDVPIKGDYGERRSKGRLHRGSDFVAPQGTLIISEKEGIVLFARYSGPGNWGNMVVASYGEPTATHAAFGMHGHMGWKNLNYNQDGSTQKENSVIQGKDITQVGITVSEGQKVTRGTILGIVGNTGRVTSKNPKGTGVHLHYQYVEYGPAILARVQGKIRDELVKIRDEQKLKTHLGFNIQKLIEDIDDLKNKYGAFFTATDPQDRAQKLYYFLTNPATQIYLTRDPVTGKNKDYDGEGKE